MARDEESLMAGGYKDGILLATIFSFYHESW
jgi:hypothetical protein